MPAWTEAQERRLLATDDATFHAENPDRSLDAIRFKRARLVRDGETHASPLEHIYRQDDRNLGIHQPKPLEGEASEDKESLEDEDALERLFTAYKEVRRARNGLGDPDRVMTWTAPDNGPIGVCFVGDVHAGGNIEYELFERDLDLIRDIDGLYMVGTGDWFDNYKAQAKNGSGLYEAVIPDSNLQVAYITTRLRRVKHKTIAICQGNHDAWDGQWAGIDRLEALAGDLGVRYFTEAGGSIFAHVGDERYHLIVKHQSRGGKRNGANTLYNEWPWTRERPDVVTLAHLHEPSLEQPIRNGEAVTYLRGGTYKLHDEWAASKGYRAHYGVPLVVLYPHERKVIPFDGPLFRDGVRFLQMERGQDT